jgi:FlaG/FlaF family flagellin (archaellin)
LKDETSNVTYKLDDQDKAKDNEGKTVTINGSLDSSTNTIRISTLQPNG